jgi:hypothetical protein
MESKPLPMNPLWLLFGTYAAAEAYKRFVTPEQKRRWENFARMHHGEAGVIMAAAGIVARSPGLAASGIGLMAHDWMDMNKWFKRQ